MQVSSSEGVANHTVPELCAEIREGFGEALTGVRLGWVLSRENKTSGTPTLCVRDHAIASRTRTVIERLDHPQFRRALQATCHCLLRHPHRARHGVGRPVLQIGQNDPRPFDTARRLGPRSTNLLQTLPLLRISRQRNHPARFYHWIPQSNPSPRLLPHLV